MCAHIHTQIHAGMHIHIYTYMCIGTRRFVYINTYIYMTMDAEHTVTTPTIIFQRLHEDCEIHITDRSKNKKRHCRIEFWECLCTLKGTLRATKLLPRSQFLHFMKIYMYNVYMCSSYACGRTYIHKYMQACTSIYTHICASVREDLCT